jgi:hypothetical protein
MTTSFGETLTLFYFVDSSVFEYLKDIFCTPH